MLDYLSGPKDDREASVCVPLRRIQGLWAVMGVAKLYEKSIICTYAVPRVEVTGRLAREHWYACGERVNVLESMAAARTPYYALQL